MKIVTALKILILMAFALSCGWGNGVLYSQELLPSSVIQQLAEMLATEDFTLDHTAFYRDWDPDCAAKSEWHLRVLQGGFDALEPISKLRSTLRDSSEAEILRHLGNIAKPDPFYSLSLPEFRATNTKELFAYAEHGFRAINSLYQKSFAALSSAQQDSLAAFLMMLMPEAEDSQYYREYFQRHNLPWQEDYDLVSYVKLILKLDLGALVAAQEAMLTLRDNLAAHSIHNPAPIIHQSQFGTMIIGSFANDVYSPKTIPNLAENPVCLIIDPQGDDIYDIPLFSSRHNPLMLLIDSQGNDLYRSTEPSFFARQGIFCSLDVAGDDIYQLADFSFSAVMGALHHSDESGNDNYQGGIFSQAAAILGIAVLIDRQGNDNYRAHSLAQAFGGTYGAGLLADFHGADTYYLGGRYFHAPLMPNEYRTMGQGMGFGLRPSLAGGLGVLYDGSGNDKYLGGVYAQGVGYWYATGILMDESGNDVYNAVYYPQGSGIHLASGILLDAEGNDAYYSRNGPGQGAGHDYGFGILIDQAGDDAYSIHGGGGLGLSNSLGIFVDVKGNDRYERREVQNYGSANFSRNSGGIGLFLDAGGEDLYSDTSKGDNQDWSHGTYGFGRDADLFPTPVSEAKEDVTQLPAPETDAPIEEIFSAASEWEVGNTINRVREARRILLERADEAREYILEHKLANDSGLEYRALQAFCRDDSLFRDLLLPRTADQDSTKAKTAISLLAGMRDSRILPYLETHLAEGRYFVTCISALGNMDSPQSLQLLIPHIHNPNERLRFLVARSLSLHQSAEAKKTLEQYREDPSFLIQALIRNLPKETP